jgi:hypothetical protein
VELVLIPFPPKCNTCHVGIIDDGKLNWRKVGFASSDTENNKTNNNNDNRFITEVKYKG